MSSTTHRALLVVDVQNDFCPGGSLAVDSGDDVAHGLASFLHDPQTLSDYDYIVASKDWHIDPGSHFSDTPDFVDSWPVHCAAGSAGAEFHPALRDITFDEIFLKGQYDAAYSSFEGVSASDDVALGEWLSQHGITDLDVVGLATDYCVQASASDSLDAGLNTRLLTKYCAGIAPETTQKALSSLAEHGAVIA